MKFRIIACAGRRKVSVDVNVLRSDFLSSSLSSSVAVLGLDFN
jgi:hypothetical protein